MTIESQLREFSKKHPIGSEWFCTLPSDQSRRKVKIWSVAEMNFGVPSVLIEVVWPVWPSNPEYIPIDCFER